MSAERLRELGVEEIDASKLLIGIEIIPTEAKKSATKLRSILGKNGISTVYSKDFFEWITQHDGASFNCVLGNPPFIRYQNFPEPSRSHAMALMAKVGLRPNKLTNIWVPFVVGATAKLLPGGRLAMVLPAELLQVSYASQLRSFLVDNFASIEIFTCNDLFFERAEQEVILLLADGRLQSPSTSNQCRIDVIDASSVEEVLLSAVRPRRNRRARKLVEHDNEKWLKYFLNTREISLSVSQS